MEFDGLAGHDNVCEAQFLNENTLIAMSFQPFFILRFGELSLLLHDSSCKRVNDKI